MRQQQDIKLRQDLDNALLDCEADRKYFASEIAKREHIINKWTNNHQDFQRESSDTINEWKQIDIKVEYDSLMKLRFSDLINLSSFCFV